MYDYIGPLILAGLDHCSCIVVASKSMLRCKKCCDVYPSTEKGVDNVSLSRGIEDPGMVCGYADALTMCEDEYLVDTFGTDFDLCRSLPCPERYQQEGSEDIFDIHWDMCVDNRVSVTDAKTLPIRMPKP